MIFMPWVRKECEKLALSARCAFEALSGRLSPLPKSRAKPRDHRSTGSQINTALPGLQRGGGGHASSLIPFAGGRLHKRQCTCPGEAVDAPPAKWRQIF